MLRIYISKEFGWLRNGGKMTFLDNVKAGIFETNKPGELIIISMFQRKMFSTPLIVYIHEISESPWNPNPQKIFVKCLILHSFLPWWGHW